MAFVRLYAFRSEIKAFSSIPCDGQDRKSLWSSLRGWVSVVKKIKVYEMSFCLRGWLQCRVVRWSVDALAPARVCILLSSWVNFYLLFEKLRLNGKPSFYGSSGSCHMLSVIYFLSLWFCSGTCRGEVSVWLSAFEWLAKESLDFQAIEWTYCILPRKLLSLRPSWSW